MRKALIYLIMLFGAVSAWAQDSLAVADVQDTASVLKGKVVPMNGAFLQPLQERDSVLVADQLFYGFELKQVEEGTLFALPEWKNDERGGVQAVSPWIVDTVKVTRQKKGMPRLLDLRGRLLITSFDEGTYELPQIMVGRLSKEGVIDTRCVLKSRQCRWIPLHSYRMISRDRSSTLLHSRRSSLGF